MPDQTVTLSNGVAMPVLGAGTYRVSEGSEVERVVRDALDLGYRHIDTAAFYGNEAGVGRAVRASGVPREKVFVTTKLANPDHRKGRAACLKAFEESLGRLDLGYVDLYLVHWPVANMYKEAWSALEEIYASGRAKAIGVSNFLPHHLDDIADAAVQPMVNQYEFHPWLVQRDLMAYCKARRIVPEAWSPLMQGHVGEVETLVDIAKARAKTPAQVVLRWNLQHGFVTIPKTTHRERLKENAAVFDFALTPEEMSRIDAADRNRRFGPHPDNVNW